MDRCPNCDHELLEGFEFCHHCGTSTQQYAEAKPRSKDLVEWVDEVKRKASQSAAVGHSLKATLDSWLGSSISTQRRIFHSLLAGLTIALTLLPLLYDHPIIWLQLWLFISLIFLPFVSYLTTGFIPFSNLINSALGDEQSLQRRLLLSLLWFTLPYGMMLSLSFFTLGLQTLANSAADASNAFTHNSTNPTVNSTTGSTTGSAEAPRAKQIPQLTKKSKKSPLPAAILSPLTNFASSYLITFYLMGFAAYWKVITGMESQLFRDKMAQDADQVAKSIHDQLKARNIRNLHIEELDMNKLRRFTAGESSGTKGHQITFTSGRARVIIFVQNFGDSLFIRWSAFYNASGRRLWLIFGLLFSFFNGFIIRWTGTNVVDNWRLFIRALSPASGSQLSMMTVRGGDASKSIAGISEYGWNEVCALEAAIKETIVDVVQKAQSGHEEAGAIRAHIEHYNRLEAFAGASNSPNSGAR